MNARPALLVASLLIVGSVRPATAAGEAQDQSAVPAATPIDTTLDITIDQAKEMILDFISGEEAKEKKAGQKKPFFITASRPILEKQDVVAHEGSDRNLYWGPWGVDPRKGTVWLHTVFKNNALMGWSLSGRIKQVDGKYRLVDTKVIEVRQPRTKAVSK